jgi:hypothetical protein
MEFLTRTWRDLRRLLAPDAWFTFVILAAVVTLEFVGRRQAVTDFHDLCILLLLGGIGWLIAKKHQISPLGWLKSLGGLSQRGRDFLHQHYAIEIGIDLRGTPPLPHGIPRTIYVVLGIMLVLAVVLALFAEAVPLGLRSLAMRVWYLGYVAILLAFWLALLAATFMSIIIPIAMIHDAFVTRSAGKRGRSRRAESIALVLYFGTFMLAAFYLPPWVPLLICLASLSVNLLTIIIPSNPDVKFIWRYRNDDPTVRAIPWGLWVTCEFGFLTLAVIDLTLLSAGSSVFGYTPVSPEPPPAAVATENANQPAAPRPATPQEVLPITTSLGLTLAWLASGALTALVVQTVLGRTRDPARPCSPVLHIRGAVPAARRKVIAESLARFGWKVHWSGGKPDPTEVGVELVDQPVPSSSENVRWPLRVTADELHSEEVRQRLARRYEIQLRRRLMAGLERLFKLAAGRSFHQGSGLWIAPHLWFIPGLTRDTQEQELDLEQGTILSGIIGKPYHRIFPRSVRHHMYQILRALQVDLIFVEDGIGFKRFCRVLRMLFELYDVYGGRRRADELHFQGIPGIRVMIHEYQLDEPFRSEVYPEPDYENLGRARILHVFKDRGEQDEPLETPPDYTNVPMPSAAM